MFVNLIKLFIFFFILYFTYNVIKTILGVRKNVNNARREYERKKNVNQNKSDDKVIELDKDQYKVE
mgnify:CR=1 FL=1